MHANIGSRFHWRGFGLVQVMLLIMLVSGLIIAGYVGLRTQAASETAAQQQRVLAQADTALAAFAATNNRLPCPDTNRSGFENCGENLQKGWLPVSTLGLDGASSQIGVAQVMYVVQHNSAVDLTTATDSWQPIAYDKNKKNYVGGMRALTQPKPGDPAAYPAVISLPDFCKKLTDAPEWADGQAGVGETPRAVAFALAHPVNSSFDGLNNINNNTPRLEAPDRAPEPGRYENRVRARSYNSLAQDLHCTTLNTSLDQLSLAVSVVEEVVGMHEDNKNAAKTAAAMAGVQLGLSINDLARTVVELFFSSGGAAITAVTCAATLGIAVNACAAAIAYTTAIGLQITAVGLGGAAIIANATAMGIALDAAVISGQITPDDAGKLVDDQAANPGGLSPEDKRKKDEEIAKKKAEAVTQQIAAVEAKTAAEEAVRTAAQAEIKAKQSFDDLTLELDQKIRLGQAGATSSSIDSKVTALADAAESWQTAETAYNRAKGELDDLNKYKDVEPYKSTTIEAARDAISQLNTQIVSIKKDIEDLKALVANYPEDTQYVTQLNGAQEALARKKGGIKELENTVEILERIAAAEISEREKSAALMLAESTFSDANTELRKVATKEYLVYKDAAVIKKFCDQSVENQPETCQNPDVTNALDNLYGRGSSPTVLSVFGQVEQTRLKHLAAIRELKDKTQALEGANKTVEAFNAMASPSSVTKPSSKATEPFTIDKALTILINADRKGGVE